MDGTTLDAENFRRAMGTIITGGGIVTPGDCAIAQQASPNMSVKVGPGQVWVPGTSTSSQGPYYSRNGADTTLTIAASSPSNPRIDTIIVQVQDVAYAGALKQIAPAVITGTPTAGATLVNLSGAGTVPASSLILGYVLVPTSATSILTANISNVVALAGGARAMSVPSGAVVQPTRVLGTSYQPNTIRPTFVVVAMNLPGTADVSVRMDAANPPTTIIADMYPGAANTVNQACSFLVPPAFYYRIVNLAGAPVITAVSEYAL